MGYTITIGNAMFESPAYGTKTYLDVVAEGASTDDAPVFENDEMTGNTNSRSPSYTVWSDFCREVGVFELFYGGGWDRDARANRPCSEMFHREYGLLQNHPGFAAINQHDVDFVSVALDKYKTKHPEARPRFSDWGGNGGATEADANLARLIWLDYWMRWAVKNCERPIVKNS